LASFGVAQGDAALVFGAIGAEAFARGAGVAAAGAGSRADGAHGVELGIEFAGLDDSGVAAVGHGEDDAFEVGAGLVEMEDAFR